MQPLALKLFGDVRLVHDDVSGGGSDIALPRKTQMLLAYLALEGGGGVPRDKLANALWADRGEEQARHSLRQCLYRGLPPQPRRDARAIFHARNFRNGRRRAPCIVAGYRAGQSASFTLSRSPCLA